MAYVLQTESRTSEELVMGDRVQPVRYPKRNTGMPLNSVNLSSQSSIVQIAVILLYKTLQNTRKTLLHYFLYNHSVLFSNIHYYIYNIEQRESDFGISWSRHERRPYPTRYSGEDLLGCLRSDMLRIEGSFYRLPRLICPPSSTSFAKDVFGPQRNIKDAMSCRTRPKHNLKPMEVVINNDKGIVFLGRCGWPAACKVLRRQNMQDRRIRPLVMRAIRWKPCPMLA